MTGLFRTFCAILCALAWGVPRADAEAVRVAAVAPGPALVLADGSTLRLAAVRAPSAESHPARAEAARAAVDALAQGKDVILDGAPRFDRHGRRIVMARLADGTVLPVALLSAGLVRVEAPEEAPEALAALYGAEAAARSARRGLWSDPAFAVLDADAVPPGRIGGFAVVEGRVVEAAEVGGRGYLNFGADWHTDFTVTASPDEMRALARVGVDWAGHAGRIVRVRGWLEDYNGPMIEIRGGGAIEVLDE